MMMCDLCRRPTPLHMHMQSWKVVIITKVIITAPPTTMSPAAIHPQCTLSPLLPPTCQAGFGSGQQITTVIHIPSLLMVMDTCRVGE